MKNPINKLTIAGSLLLSCFIYIIAGSCIKGPPEGSRAAQAMRGQEHYVKYCAACHGEDGKGLDIDSLHRMPADLTRITENWRTGKFPVVEVARMIDGRDMVKSHGTRQMPVWGEVFSTQEHLDETEIKGKLGEIIAYLMTIQGN